MHECSSYGFWKIISCFWCTRLLDVPYICSFHIKITLSSVVCSPLIIYTYVHAHATYTYTYKRTYTNIKTYIWITILNVKCHYVISYWSSIYSYCLSSDSGSTEASIDHLRIGASGLWAKFIPISMSMSTVTFSTDDNFKFILLNENYRIPIRISLKFFLKCSFDNKPAMVQVMARCLTGDQPLPELMLTSFTGAYMRHYESLPL